MKRIPVLISLLGFLVFGAPSCPSSSQQTPGAPADIKSNPGTEMNGGFDAGNPGETGGFDAGNPVAALRILTGRLEEKKTETETSCAFGEVVLVDGALKHTVVPVDASKGCSWKKEVPVSQPVAVVGVGDHQAFSVSDLNKEPYQVLGPGKDEVNLGLLTFDLDSQSLLPEFPIASKNLLAGSGADADGDGIDDEFDGLNDALLYGIYKPGAVTNRARGGTEVCPKAHQDGVWIEIKPWTPPDEPGVKQINNVDLIFHPVGYDPETGDPAELKQILRGRLKAGFLQAVSPTALPTVCNGWVTPAEVAGNLSLKITCRPTRGADGYCEYADFAKPH